MQDEKNVLQSILDHGATIPAQKTEEWLEWRTGRITGTDWFKLFSNSPNPNDLHELMLKKLGQSNKIFTGNAMTEHGNYYEDVAIERYEQLTGKKVYQVNGLQHLDCPYMAMSPDGITEDGILIEIKCPYSRKIDGKISTPYKYQMQCGLEVLRSRGLNTKCHFVEFKPKNFGYSANEILSISIVEPDFKILNQMPKKAVEFFKLVEDNKNTDHDGFLD